MKLKIACLLLLAVAAQVQFIESYTGYPLLPAATDAAPFRAKRQLGGVLDKIFKSPPRWGRSVNDMIEPEASPDMQWKSVDSAPSRTKRQIQLRFPGRRRGRSVSEITEPTGTDYESVDAAPSSTKYQSQLQYGGNRPDRSLKEPGASKQRQI